MVVSERFFGASVCHWKPAGTQARMPSITVRDFSSPSLVDIDKTKRNIEKCLSKTESQDEIRQRIMVNRFSANQ